MLGLVFAFLLGGDFHKPSTLGEERAIEEDAKGTDTSETALVRYWVGFSLAWQYSIVYTGVFRQLRHKPHNQNSPGNTVFH